MQYLTICLLVLVALALPACTGGEPTDVPSSNSQPAETPSAPRPAALDFIVTDIHGNQVDLAKAYAGKVVLVVNVASKCGFTKQYAGLEALHETYADRGLAVLGFPCNQFGGQEPGTEAEIMEFCTATYGVKFPMFAKIDVNGDNAAPLYRTLTGENAPVEDKGPVKWNFEKFLIGRDGKLIARYRSRATPEQLAPDIEAALGM